MPKYTFNTDMDFKPMRLDKYLADSIGDLSRSKIKELLIAGNVTVNSTVVNDPSAKVMPESLIQIKFELVTQTSITPKAIPLDIVYEDDDLLVLNKQPSLTVHPGAATHDDTLVNALVHHCGDKLSNVAGEARPGIVHRLDRDTSGLMVVAKNNFAHSKLSNNLAKRLISRKYIALIYKTLSPKLGKITTGYGKSKRDPTRMVANFSKDKLAITNYRVLKEFYNETLSLVEFILETGRTHQIRFHLEHMGTRLIGEKVYSKSINFNFSDVPDET
jgi:23S rRNA pseudouridine1911/1915/1917 synthase